MIRLLFILFCTSVYSQTSFEVKYDLILIKDDTSELDKLLLGMSPDLFRVSKEVEFQLLVSPQKSYYQIPKILWSDEGTGEIVLVKAKYFGPTIQSSDNIIQYRKAVATKRDYVVRRLPIQWDITDESKKIGNYTCIKAISETIVENEYGTFHHPIEAWFTPQIPYSYGPSFYGGLPGLILEVRTNKYVLGASKITPSKKSLDIPKFPNAPIISYEEYSSLIRTQFGN